MWECTACGFWYDPEEGDPTMGIPSGTDLANLPDDWTCPDCGAAKQQFTKV